MDYIKINLGGQELMRCVSLPLTLNQGPVKCRIGCRYRRKSQRQELRGRDFNSHSVVWESHFTFLGFIHLFWAGLSLHHKELESRMIHRTKSEKEAVPRTRKV